MSVEKAFENEKVLHLTLHDPAIVTEETSLLDTVRCMQSHKTGCATVLRKKRLVGVFTERDLLRKVIMARFPLSDAVEKHMTKDPVHAPKDASVGEVIRLMEVNEVRHLPLVDVRKDFVAMVTIRNIIDYLAEHFPAEVLNLPPRLDQKIRSVEGG